MSHLPRTIIYAIRNIFKQRKPKPTPARKIDGQLGQMTRNKIAEYAAVQHMPTLLAFEFWKVTPYGRGSFRVGLYEHAPGEPRLKTSICGLMEELSPQMIITMARTIARATGNRQ